MIPKFFELSFNYNINFRNMVTKFHSLNYHISRRDDRMGFGIVEIKCLHSFKEQLLENVPCLDKSGQPEKTDSWYTQIQV